MTLSLQSIYATLAVCSFVLVGGLLLQPTSVHAQYYSWYHDHTWSSWGGVYAWRSDYLGPTSRCTAPGTAEYSFTIKEYNSDTPISQLNGIWLRPYKDTGSTIEYNTGGWWGNGWYELGAGEYAYICADTDHHVGVVIQTETGSPYKGADTYTTRATSSQARIAEIGGHYAFGLHLQERSDTDTVTPTYPQLEAINSDPSYTLQLNDIPNIYGATGVLEGWHTVYDWETGTVYYKPDMKSVNGMGVGQYTLPSWNLPSDGYHTWIASLTLNGSQTVGSTTYTELPQTQFYDNWANFILDRTAPVANLTVTQTSEDSSSRTLQLENEAQDAYPGSGLASVDFVVENLDSGLTSVSTITWPLENDFYFGPRDRQSASTIVTLAKDTNYDIYTVTTDVAGNVTQSAVTNYAAMSVQATPVNLTFATNPTTVNSGDSSTLQWTVSGADTCSTNGWLASPTAADGTYTHTVTNITSDQTFELTCSNATDSQTRTANVTVSASVTPPPIINITASSNLVRSGQTVTLDWSATPSTAMSDCTVTGLAGSSATPVPLVGNQVSGPIQNTREFTLRCLYNGVPIEDTTTVNVVSTNFES